MNYLQQESASANAAIRRTRQALGKSAHAALRPGYLLREHPVAVAVAAIGSMAVAGVALYRFLRYRPNEPVESRVVKCRSGPSFLGGLVRTVFGVLVTRFLTQPVTEDARAADAGMHSNSE